MMSIQIMLAFLLGLIVGAWSMYGHGWKKGAEFYRLAIHKSIRDPDTRSALFQLMIIEMKAMVDADFKNVKDEIQKFKGFFG